MSPFVTFMLIIAFVIGFSFACGFTATKLIYRFAPRTSDDQMPASILGVLTGWAAFFVANIFAISFVYSIVLQDFKS